MRRLGEIDWYKKTKENEIDIKIFLVERPGIRENDILTLQTLAKASREDLIFDSILNDSTKEELEKKVYKQIIKK
jgi:uncharacterized glyoxalase superfamily metalloenzyme YdcJ